MNEHGPELQIDAGPPGLEAVLGVEPRRLAARLLERIRHLVEAETPSGDAARAAALAAKLDAAFAELGAVGRQIEAPGWGKHLLVRVPGTDSALQPLMLLGHLDTVHAVGSIAARPFRVEDGRAYAPGIFDMKSPIAVLLEALRLLRLERLSPRRPLEILITCDEEVGSLSSHSLIQETARRAAAVLVLEPPLPGGAAKTARKGAATYELKTFGIAAHAGIEPERGVSATRELAIQVLRVLDLADAEMGSTLSVGLLGGGTATNVVAAEAWAKIDVRFASAAEQQRLDAALRGLVAETPGARLQIECGEERPPLERDEGVLRLFQHARTLAAEFGFVLEEGSTGGGSDGCLTAALGVPTLDGIGVDGGGAHADDEHIVIADLPRRVALIRRLLETL